MTRTIQLRVVTSPDGTKCDAECPQFSPPSGKWRAQCRTPDGYQGMGAHGGEDHDVARLPWCIAAETAAREAEVDALQRVVDAVDAKGGGFGEHDRLLFDAEIERVRRGAP